MEQRSKLFQRNRALGYVSNHIPLVVRYIENRKEHLVVTSVGKSFHTYGSAKFGLLSVSNLHSDDICCIAGDRYHIYTASGCNIYAWRRGKELKHTYVGHSKPVHILLPFGSHLISIDEDSNLKVWDIETEELHLELTFANEVFHISAAMHPSTYLNKILLGSKQGTMQLWNVHTSKMIYVFQGWESEITVLEQAPAVDVVAVGLVNGKIILHNLKFDQVIVDFFQDWGIVTSISFRTDGVPIMVSGTAVGHIVLWNLEERKVFSQILKAHKGAVTGLHCLSSEPLFVTSSPDNTLKMWIFDMPDGGARLLRLREGHSVPPSFIKHYGSDGHNILSAGGDSTIRIFSVKNETFNKSLGVASYNRKKTKTKDRLHNDPNIMPAISKYAFETVREKQWDNIAAIHGSCPVVTTWSYDKLKMGDKKLKVTEITSEKEKIKHIPSCVCVSSCGNFAVIGYISGQVHKFNIQSGNHRFQYGQPTAHKGPVKGITTDALSQILITGGNDNYIKFWHFRTPGTQISQMVLKEPIMFFNIHRESSLLAVAMQDYTIILLDLDTRTIIRKFCGHSSQITDITFSPDSRWLIAASLDCSIRTWDIPSANLVDCFQVDAPCTSLSFSPTGDFLATTHVNHLGIFLWSNRTLYTHISLRPIAETSAIPVLTLPSTTSEPITCEEQYIEEDDIEYKSPDQINEDLVTMSLVPNSRWQNLLSFDTIIARNKPKDAPKKPKSAPFFLPTIPSLELQFDLSKEKNDNDDQLLSIPSNLQGLTVFGKMLHDTVESNDFGSSVNKLKELGLSAINFEINSLAPEGGGSIEVMLQFMKLIESMFLSNQDFELAQAYFGLFLKRHGDIIASEPELRDYLPIMEQCQKTGWLSVQNKFLYCLGVVNLLKST